MLSPSTCMIRRRVSVPAIIEQAGSSLPQLVDHAAAGLSNARTAAEVLEAKDIASFAYDTAKRAARLARARGIVALTGS